MNFIEGEGYYVSYNYYINTLVLLMLQALEEAIIEALQSVLKDEFEADVKVGGRNSTRSYTYYLYVE